MGRVKILPDFLRSLAERGTMAQASTSQFLSVTGPMDNKELTAILEGRFYGDPLEEIVHLVVSIRPGFDGTLIRQVHADVIDFFSGNDPRFQKSTLPYHNLRHSQLVVLATARLFHGLHCDRIPISADMLFKGLLAAYFHDSGLLLEANDPAPSGTVYMDGHEARSIFFLQQYALAQGFSEDVVSDCAVIINYTNLHGDPATFTAHRQEIQLAGQVVGSSDILAQMADRCYLECLPQLFHELEAGRISRHRSALELMEHTANFYEEVVLRRLVKTFANTAQAMRTHFRERYAIDRNLYIENIDKNINYLKEVINKCKALECVDRYLKRTPPVT
jgi:hypothetical protein